MDGKRFDLLITLPSLDEYSGYMFIRPLVSIERVLEKSGFIMRFTVLRKINEPPVNNSYNISLH